MGPLQRAQMGGVHRSTAARWLARVRERLYEGTRDHLMQTLNLGNDEFRSLLGLVRSQLDYSIGRHLQEFPADHNP